ncbi:hypothetical protein NE237_027760 [Protea cynaroides]|uniref:Uncharacterized protein n=1 Tax=Protea cynaroides TaxID=273540 RepID=A0A9Q0JUP1_9MAGN|nr:hypothetical protein NE237_027760 [Protea cynaroides]
MDQAQGKGSIKLLFAGPTPASPGHVVPVKDLDHFEKKIKKIRERKRQHIYNTQLITPTAIGHNKKVPIDRTDEPLPESCERIRLYTSLNLTGSVTFGRRNRRRRGRSSRN